MTSCQLAPLTIALASIGLSGAPSTPVQEERTTSRLTLPQSVGPPGGNVAVPIQVAAAEGVQIGSLTLTLRFPATQLTFIKLEMGGLGQAVDAEATTKLDTNADETRLEVTITAPEKEGFKIPLPDGPVAQLMFTIAKELKPESVISLKVVVLATGIKPGAEPVRVAARDAEVIISNPSVIGCFFYMH